MIDDFIGVYDNVCSREECDHLIQYFENMKSLNLTFDREPEKRTGVEDESVLMSEFEEMSLDHTQTALQLFLSRLGPCYNNYVERYGVIGDSAKHGLLHLKLQKTRPGQGFHIWHFETSSLLSSPRFITYMMYLNDVDDGGETEFLYLHKRIKPQAGRVLIWPSGFAHTHRGNPPLSGNKYIITGWMTYLE